MYFPLFVGVLFLSLFWYALRCVLSSFADERELVALLLLLCGSSPRRRGLGCSMCLWYFLVILTFGQAHRGLIVGFILLLYSVVCSVESISLLYLLFIS